MSEMIYSVTSQKQLVDLNGESRNFDLTFTAESEDGEPFEAIVIDQNTVDTHPDIAYKRVEGHISGNVIADKDVYQNYYLALRADKPCKVKVSIQKREIPPASQPQQAIVPKIEAGMSHPVPAPPVNKGWNKKTWVYIGIGAAVVIGCFALYYFTKKPSEQSSNTTVKPVATKRCPVPSAPSVPKVEIPVSLNAPTPVVSAPKVDVSVPQPQVAVSNVSTPQVSVPNVSTPEVSVPQVSVPKVSVPQVVDVPALSSNSLSPAAVEPGVSSLMDRLKRLPLPK
jgi:hypothetical protein